MMSEENEIIKNYLINTIKEEAEKYYVSTQRLLEKFERIKYEKNSMDLIHFVNRVEEKIISDDILKSRINEHKIGTIEIITNEIKRLIKDDKTRHKFNKSEN